MEHDHDQSTDADESSPTTVHTRRDMLKIASTVGAASLGAVSLTGTAAATSDTPSEPTRAETPQEQSFTSSKHRSDDVEALAVRPWCIWQSGNPGVTIRGGSCAEHAYGNAWDYAGYILNSYPDLDDCRTQLSVAGEIEAHEVGQPGESITIGCGVID